MASEYESIVRLNLATQERAEDEVVDDIDEPTGTPASMWLGHAAGEAIR